MTHPVLDPNYEERVRASFAAQAFMGTLGAELESIAPGEVVIILPYRPDLTQQHGFLHAGAIATVADSACGYAALTLMEPGSAVLSVEFKINLLAPARGSHFRAVGHVVRAGRTLTACEAEVRALAEDSESLVATMQSTMISLRDRPELRD